MKVIWGTLVLSLTQQQTQSNAFSNTVNMGNILKMKSSSLILLCPYVLAFFSCVIRYVELFTDNTNNKFHQYNFYCCFIACLCIYTIPVALPSYMASSSSSNDTPPPSMY